MNYLERKRLRNARRTVREKDSAMSGFYSTVRAQRERNSKAGTITGFFFG